jgi:hypothetical protein
VESIARTILDWLGRQCAADRDYATGNLYETAWSEDITNLLIGQGRTATHQKCYPGSRKTCDVVTALSGDKKLWIEVKGAWLTTQHDTDPDGRIKFRKNPVFRKHLFNAQESALKDLNEKIGSIVGPDTVGAVLLIGYDSYGCAMDGAIDELISTAVLDRPPWGGVYREWQNPFDGKYRIRCWFWYR